MNLLWIDLEMTGLDVQKEVIIEVAAIAADLDFEEKETYHSVVKQPQHYLDAMDEWNQNQHSQSGLIKQIPLGQDPEIVDQDLAELVDRHFQEPAIIAGNSIAQDRLFIEKYFKALASRLHYRVLDVTAWKIIMENKYEKKYQKQNCHRALDDIRESMAELEYYLKFLKEDIC